MLRNSLDAQKKDLERARLQVKVEPASNTPGTRRTGRPERSVTCPYVAMNVIAAELMFLVIVVARAQEYTEQRRALLEAHEDTKAADESLIRTQQTLDETYQVGSTVSTRLLEQREQISRTRDTVRLASCLSCRQSITQSAPAFHDCSGHRVDHVG